MSNYLIKTAESTVKQDKNGKNYKTVSLTEVVMMKTPFGDVMKPTSQTRTRNINAYEESYLNGKEQPGYSDPLFDPKHPAKGGLFMGSIETRMVEEYDIEAADGAVRAVDKYTTVVFGDSDSPSFESDVKSAFKSQGHEIVVASAPIIVHSTEPKVEEPVF